MNLVVAAQLELKVLKHSDIKDLRHDLGKSTL